LGASFGLILVALLVIFLLSGLVSAPFWRAWAATGVRAEAYAYTSWGVWNHRFSSLGELEDEARLVSGDLHLPKDAPPAVTVGGLFRQVRIVNSVFNSPKGGEVTVTVIGQTLDLHPGLGQAPVTYLVIDAKSGSNAAIKAEIRQIQTLYGGFGLAPWPDLSATGTIPGRLSPSVADSLRRRVLAVLAASIVEATRGNTSALSPLLSPSITVAGKQINLQLAYRYDPRRHLTTVSLGTPVIPVAY
jgi:hypothetical protein